MLRFWSKLFLKEKPPLDAATQEVLAQVLESYLTLPQRNALTKTSGTFRQHWLLDVRREELMHRVLWNNQEKAKALLEEAKSHSTERLRGLLCEKVVNAVAEPSGKVFKKITPFQAALCTQNEMMCELFKGYFEQIPNGLEIMQAQIKKIFPEGFPEERDPPHIEKQKRQALKFKEETLRPLIAVMISNTTSKADVKVMLEKKCADSTLGKAIGAFRDEIKKLSYADPVSNRFYLQEAFNLYVECFNTFTTLDQRDLFYIQVIGFIQCYSPAADLQAFAQGLCYLVEERQSFRGSFEFTHSHCGVDHLEIKMKNFGGLGFDYWADACRAGRGLVWRGAVRSSMLIRDFCQTKTTGFTNFVQGLQQPMASSVMPCSGK